MATKTNAAATREKYVAFVAISESTWFFIMTCLLKKFHPILAFRFERHEAYA
jgi:hypothetical protein